MKNDRETLELMAAWLEEGRTELPDHVLDAVLEQLPTKPQRRATWLARRMPNMNGLAKFAMAAAVAALVAVIGYNLLGQRNASEIGGVPPSVTTSPSPSPAASTAPDAPTSGALDPGRYRWAWPGAQVSFVVRDGWTASDDGFGKNPDQPAEAGLGHWLPGSGSEVTRVYADACRSAGQLQPIGATVDDLVAALENQAATEVVATTFATDSIAGRRVEVRATPDLDRSACRLGSTGPLQVWAYGAETGFFSLSPGYWGVVYAFDVNDRLVTFTGIFGPEATNADVAEVDAVVRSFEFSTP